MAFIVFSLFFVGALVIALWLTGKESKVELASRLRAVFVGVAGLFALLMVSCMLVVIDAGNIGVVDVFGNVSPNTLKSGLNLVNPLARVVQMSIQTVEKKETMDVPSKEGMTMSLEMSVLYHLDPDKAGQVYAGKSAWRTRRRSSSRTFDPWRGASRRASRRRRSTRQSASRWNC